MRAVAAHLEQTTGVRVAASTVYAWVLRASLLAAEWMDGLGARTGERWQVDETVVSVGGRPRYVWNVLDAQTRFLLATHVSRLRRYEDTRVPLQRAKRATPDRPMEVLTDGMLAYPRAVTKELSYRVAFTGVSPHRRVRSIRSKVSNNRVERLHGTEKDRIRVMRGFDNRRGAMALMEGFRAHYNLVRDHTALGTTPAVAAGLPRLEGFRWKTILRAAAEAPPRGSVLVELIVTPRGSREPRSHQPGDAEIVLAVE